jgi:hypothetical protein
MPHSISTAPAQTTTPSGAHFSTITLVPRPPSTSSTPSTTAPRATDLSKASVLQGAEAGTTNPSSSTVPSRGTMEIKCHCCHALQTNYAGDLADDGDDEHIFGSGHTAEYSTKTYVVQWVLSAQIDQSKKLQ